MKNWKWMTLLASGALLLQVNTCVTDFAYYVLQLLATQLVSGALAGITT